MAEREKQHYVSQFLLRNFSADSAKLAVNLYNKNTDRLVRGAAIKTQAQEKFYYGEDPAFELYLAHVESTAARVIGEIIRAGNIVDRVNNRKEYAYLLNFVTSYVFRTKATVDRIEEKMNDAFRILAKFDPDFKDLVLEQYSVKHPEPAAFVFASQMDNWVVTADLEPFLLLNETGIDFFISDNPLVIFNPMMQRRGEYALSTGILNKGLLLLLPLSAKHCLMLVDSWAYDVYCSGSRVILNEADDINNINLLQAIASDRNIYFTDFSAAQYVRQTALESTKHKIDKSVNQVIDHPDKAGAKLFFQYHLLHKINPPFSFIREGKEAIQYNCAEHTQHIRNEAIADWVKVSKEKLWNKNANR